MADTGSTILNLPPTVALNDTDVLPLARPSGTTAPGTDLGLGGAALKNIITGLAHQAIPLYTTSGTASDGPMTQGATTTVTGLLNNLITNDRSSLASAINEVKTLEYKAASVLIGVAADGTGGVLTIFPSYEQAEAAAPTGSDIGLTGYHRVINVDKSVNISGGTVGTAVIGYNSTGITVRLHGLSALSRFVTCAAAAAGAVNAVEFSDLTTGPGFFLESYGIFTNGLATISAVNCRARNNATYVPPASSNSNGTAGGGVVRFQERGSFSQWNFRNCDLRSNLNVVFSGYPNSASRVTLEAATVLTPGPGRITQDTQVINSGVNTPDANFYIDNRAFYAPRENFAVLPYAASIALDFNAANVQTLNATGNVVLSASVNVALLKTKELYLFNSTSAAISVAYPAGWAFFPGPGPTTLAANTQAVLTLRALGSGDTDIKARFALGPVGPLVTNFSATPQ